jgi:CIC family chloride channel protein
MPVSAVMGPVPDPLPDTLPLLEAVSRLRDAPEAILPVVDDRGAYRGVVTGRLVADVLTTEHGEDRTVSDATDTPPTVRAAQTLDAVIDTVDHVGTPAVPVMDETGRQLVGWLTASRMLNAVRPSSG